MATSRPATCPVWERLTELFSLAVLLFSMFMLQHPPEGKKERDLDLFDLEAIHRLYGTEPVFIFDPDNDTNRPVPGLHDHGLIYWSLYPTFFKRLFVEAFTQGLHNPQERVRESIWHQGLIRLHDALIACLSCGAKNFYDGERLQQTGGTLARCWVCQQPVPLPPRIRLGQAVVMLNQHTRLYRHHIDINRHFDFSHPVAEVTRHPSDPTIWGLQNVSTERWVSIPTCGSAYAVPPGRTITPASGSRIEFGTSEGEIRV